MTTHAVNCNISEKLSDVCSCGTSPTQGEKPAETDMDAPAKAICTELGFRWDRLAEVDPYCPISQDDLRDAARACLRASGFSTVVRTATEETRDDNV